MALPAFSVIIPTYNRQRTIERALDSVLAQHHHRADEIILIDDASRDDTVALVARRYPDVRLMRHETKRGPAAARNTAMRLATHDLLAFLDSDDAWHEDYLAAIGEAWAANPKASLVHTQYHKIEDWPGGRIDPIEAMVEGDQTEAMLRNNFIHSCSLMSTRRDWAMTVGGFDTAYKIGEDRMMYLKLLQLGPAVPVHQHLVRRYVGDDNMIHDFDRWWQDAVNIVSRVVAQPEFATYRWIEDESRLRLWETIRLHRRQLDRVRKARDQPSASKATGSNLPAVANRAPKPTDDVPIFLFLHAGGLPTEALSTQFDAVEAFGDVRPWFDRSRSMLEAAAARSATGFDDYLDNLIGDTRRTGRPWSALVDFRDIAWMAQKSAFQALLQGLHCRLVRVRSRNLVLQASRRRDPCGDQTSTFDELAEALVDIDQAETSIDRWLDRGGFRTSLLWLEDLAAPDAPGLRGLVTAFDLEPADGAVPSLAPASEAELASVRSFRQEAARRHWSHALLPGCRMAG